MGDRTIILLLGACCLVASAHGELLLVPSTTSYELDGSKFSQLAFTDGAKKVTYAPPAQWAYSGSSNQLTLHPPHKQLAEATISRMAVPQIISLDDEGTKKLVKEALASVPATSTNVQLVSQEKNPVLIDRKETLLVVVSYDLLGVSYDRSILFMNRGKEQIRFQVVCRQADFAELQKAFLASQYSWQNL
jgi:hypothetical protein